MTCHQWVRKAGLSRAKVRKQSVHRKYTARQKEQFFVLFDRLKNTVETAKELGLNPNTCAAWVRKAGMKGQGKPSAGHHPGREEFFRLRKAGVSRRKAAVAVGIHLRTAEEWDQGIRKSGGDAFIPTAGWWTTNVVWPPLPLPLLRLKLPQSRYWRWRNLSTRDTSMFRNGN